MFILKLRTKNDNYRFPTYGREAELIIMNFLLINFLYLRVQKFNRRIPNYARRAAQIIFIDIFVLCSYDLFSEESFHSDLTLHYRFPVARKK